MRHDPYEVELAREMLYAVLSRCPLEGSTEDCQLCSTRQQPLADRQRWLLALDDDECLRLAREHRACIAHQVHGTEPAAHAATV